MDNIYKHTCDTLALIGYPVKEQGSYAGQANIPESVITYQIINSPNKGYADNKPKSVTYQIQISLYSKKPTVKQSADETLKAILLPAGFMRGNGRDLPYDAKTGHYGFTCDYRFYEREEQ